MTKREFLEKVITLEGVSEEMVAFAENEIEQIDASNKKAAERRAAKRAEDQPLIDQIMDMVKQGEEPITASEAGEVLEVSTQKASALLRRLVSDNVLVVEDIKKGSRAVKGYTLV